MTRKLRIGITCYPTYGGSGIIATEIGMALAKRGHKVHFVCSEVPRRLARFRENIYFHEVEVHEYPLFTFRPYAIGLASKMVEVITYENLDLLHVHYAVPHATSGYLAKQVMGDKAPRLITTLHGTDITLVGYERSYLPITRFSIEKSDGITAPSQYLKFATYDKLNVSTDVPIEVIPNFVDTDKFKPSENCNRARLCEYLGCGPSCDEKILTHVSNFRPVKRLADIVQIFAEVQKSIPAHLVLIGDGPDRSAIEDQVHRMGLSSQVSFLGKQELFVEVLQCSDLFLLPSETESFGLASLEAMSCAVPVISSEVGGIPEVVTHGETGFLAPVGDIEAMAKNALTLLSNNALQKKFGTAARKRVLENYALEPVVSQYEDYYMRILGS